MAQLTTPSASVLTTPSAGVPSLSLESFGDYTQRSTHRSTQRSTQRSIATSEGGTPLDQKQARLQAARQRQVEQRREGVAMALLLQSTLDRACMACRALQRWREFSARADPTSPLPPPSATAAAATPAALDAHDAEFRSRAGVEAAYKQREAALLAQLRDADVAIQRAEKRALEEIGLLNREAREELRDRLLHAERETQAALLGHVYEKQHIAAVHQKALQEAEFAKLDMLAQQEVRAKLRESRQFDAVQKQLGQLRGQLEERQSGADEMLRLLAADEQAQEELRALRSQLSSRTPEAPTPAAATPAAPTPEVEAPPEAEGDQSSDMPDWLAEAEAETAPATEAPPTPAPAPTPALFHPAPTPPASARTPGGYAAPSEDADAATATLAAARELEELRRRLAAADAREALLRSRHEEEVQQCDEQAARLREALRSQAKRLDETEAQLHEAQQSARHAAEEARTTRAAAEEQTQQWQAVEQRARAQQRQPAHGGGAAGGGGALPHRPPQVRTSDDHLGTPGGLSPLSEGAAEVSFDLGAELLAQRAQELFAEMPFGSPFGSPRRRSAAPSPLSRPRSAAPSPRS